MVLVDANEGDLSSSSNRTFILFIQLSMLAMVRGMLPAYERAQSNDSTKVVILKGAGPKAFCAGGDVVGEFIGFLLGYILTSLLSSSSSSSFIHQYLLSQLSILQSLKFFNHLFHTEIYKSIKNDTPLYKQFFYEEFQLDYMISQFKKPHVALIDGITSL